MFTELSGASRSLTMFLTGTMRIFFLSRHVSLRQACDLVRAKTVLECLQDCHQALGQLGLLEPRIAVAGLNPHCGEHGLFGDEEENELLPAIAQARAQGIDAQGPIGADSVFYLARIGQFDAVLSLYHDQGHIAAKTLDFDRTITMTLGLPFLRVSVDHGTALDIAGKGIARSLSMETALLVALEYRQQRDWTINRSE
jgi:4-hydroxythreonine-4-phosphate dehydrogenase